MEMKLRDKVPSLGESNSLETVFLILGHPMFNHLPQIMVPMTKEIILHQQYKLPKAFMAGGMKWAVRKPADQSNGNVDAIPSFSEEDTPEAIAKCTSYADTESWKLDRPDSPPSSNMSGPVQLLCRPMAGSTSGHDHIGESSCTFYHWSKLANGWKPLIPLTFRGMIMALDED